MLLATAKKRLHWRFGQPKITGMNPKQVIQFWKTGTNVARVLGCSQAVVSEWLKAGQVPEARQYQIEIASGGRLRADLPADRTLGELTPPLSRLQATEAFQNAEAAEVRRLNQ